MVTFNLKADFSRSKRTFRDLPQRIAKRIAKTFGDIGLDFVRRIKLERFSGRPALYRRTGELSRSIHFEVKGQQLNTLTLRIYSDSPYAKIQEFGGTIKPKNAQWLAIPLDAVKTGTGVARGGPRDYENTFFAKSKKGNLILFQKNEGKVTPLFVMKKEVTIPPRLGLHTTWDSLAERRNDLLRAALKG